MTPSSTPAERPLRRDAARNRDLLLDAAATVFAQQGLGVSVDEIARAAGVGIGTLYRRFPTKEALVEELVHGVLRSVVAAGRGALSRDADDGFETFLAEAAEHLTGHRGCLPRLWGGNETTAALREEFREVAGELLEDAQRAGRVRDDLTPQDVAVVLWAVRGVIETTGDAAPDAWRRHLELLLLGLRPSPVPLVRPSLTRAEMLEVGRSARTAR